MYLCLYVYVYVDVYVRSRARTCVFVYGCVWMTMYVRVCICVCMHVYVQGMYSLVALRERYALCTQKDTHKDRYKDTKMSYIRYDLV
jgi:hypothetical protein